MTEHVIQHPKIRVVYIPDIYFGAMVTILESHVGKPMTRDLELRIIAELRLVLMSAKEAGVPLHPNWDREPTLVSKRDELKGDMRISFFFGLEEVAYLPRFKYLEKIGFMTEQLQLGEATIVKAEQKATDKKPGVAYHNEVTITVGAATLVVRIGQAAPVGMKGKLVFIPNPPPRSTDHFDDPK